jgi:hypothetical protein
MLAFYSIICDAYCCGIITMDLCFLYMVAQFFEGHPEYHALFAVEEEGVKFGLGG